MRKFKNGLKYFIIIVILLILTVIYKINPFSKSQVTVIVNAIELEEQENEEQISLKADRNRGKRI